MVTKSLIDLAQLTRGAVTTEGIVTRDKQGRYNVTGSVQINAPFDIQLGEVTGDLWAIKSGLVTLKGFPLHVKGFCDVSQNALDSLAHSPLSIGGVFNIFSCGLTSLEGCTPKCRGLNANDNKLTNLKGIPQDLHLLALSKNSLLKDLSALGRVHIVRIDYSQDLGLLPLLVAARVVFTDHDPNSAAVGEILENYAGQGRNGAIACAAELAKAGFKENARW